LKQRNSNQTPLPEPSPDPGLAHANGKPPGGVRKNSSKTTTKTIKTSRSEPTRPAEVARAAEPVEPKPVEVPPADLTAGQREFLDALSAEQRDALAAMSERKRADILAPHAKGFDADLLGFQIRSGFFRPPESPPPEPELAPTVEELLRKLPGADKAWSWDQKAAEALVRAFGTGNDQKLWGQIHLITRAVRIGTIDPDHVINAYTQAMKPHIENHGAKFWAALKGLAGIDAHSLKQLAGGGS
jgi:hypothetical protein